MSVSSSFSQSAEQILSQVLLIYLILVSSFADSPVAYCSFTSLRDISCIIYSQIVKLELSSIDDLHMLISYSFSAGYLRI